MRQPILSILFLFVCSALYAQQDPFTAIDHDRVVAYEFDGTGARTIDHCLHRERTRIEKERELQEAEINEIQAIITGKGAYGSITAACFDPHFAIVYFKDEEIVGQVDVCLSCNYLRSSEPIEAMTEVMIDEGTEFERALYGFSKETRGKLDGFLKKIGFEKYLMPPGSVFDE